MGILLQSHERVAAREDVAAIASVIARSRRDEEQVRIVAKEVSKGRVTKVHRESRRVT